MTTFLGILDFLVVLAVMVSTSRAVGNGQSESSRLLLLPSLIVPAMCVFRRVSVSSASGLTSSSWFSQVVLLILLAAIAVVGIMSWADKFGRSALKFIVR